MNQRNNNIDSIVLGINDVHTNSIDSDTIIHDQ